jgi:hypothetical protein
MEQLLTPQFCHDKWAVLNGLWAIIPSLLLAAFVGWMIRGVVLKNAIGSQLRLARDQRASISDDVIRLKAMIARQDDIIAALSTIPASAEHPRIKELTRSNIEVKSVLSNLAQSTTNLGVTLMLLDREDELR